MYQSFTPKHCNYYIHMSILEKSETKITILETQYGDDCPFSKNVIMYQWWDILTPDAESNQVIQRTLSQIHWVKKPLVWKMLHGILEKDWRILNGKFPSYFIESSVDYLKGPPYENATYVDRTIQWPFWVSENK